MAYQFPRRDRWVVNVRSNGEMVSGLRLGDFRTIMADRLREDGVHPRIASTVEGAERCVDYLHNPPIRCAVETCSMPRRCRDSSHHKVLGIIGVIYRPAPVSHLSWRIMPYRKLQLRPVEGISLGLILTRVIQQQITWFDLAVGRDVPDCVYDYAYVVALEHTVDDDGNHVWTPEIEMRIPDLKAAQKIRFPVTDPAECPIVAQCPKEPHLPPLYNSI